MTITYLDGRAVEAVLLSRTDDTIRVAVVGAEDVTQFSNINGTWVSEDCEPARIEFAWHQKGHKPTISEADCCCSHELAARLVHLLFTDSKDEEDAVPPSVQAAEASGALKNTIRPAASAN